MNASGWSVSELTGALALAFAVLSAIAVLLYRIINDPEQVRTKIIAKCR